MNIQMTAPTANEEKDQSVSAEAISLVYGDRGAAYGHPIDDYRRTAAMWSAILGTEVTPMQAILCMIAVKLSRQVNAPKRDNLVDIAGYAECAHRVQMRLDYEDSIVTTSEPIQVRS